MRYFVKLTEPSKKGKYIQIYEKEIKINLIKL